MQRVLIGYVLMYAALEGSARLASGLGQRALITPLAGAIRRVLLRSADARALVFAVV